MTTAPAGGGEAAVPELIEVEVYRRLADRAVGRTVEAVEAPDAWFIKGGAHAPEVVDARHGRDRARAPTASASSCWSTSTATRPVLGLRFGMTGRLVLDGEAPIAELEYSSGRDDPAWDRFALRFDDGGRLRMSDPRRLGGVELDPDVEGLGPDAWSITVGSSARPSPARRRR